MTNFPKPWKHIERRGKRIVIDADGNDICIVTGETTSEAAQVARYIVESVNRNFEVMQ